MNENGEVKIVVGNIFRAQWDAFVHCCNLYKRMGAGIAYIVARDYPSVAEADRQFPAMLGAFSSAVVEGRTFYNLYAQTGIGNDGNPENRNLRYDHLYDGLRRIAADVASRNGHKIALPWIGCGLAGGNRKAVLGIVEAVAEEFSDKGIEFTIYQIEPMV